MYLLGNQFDMSSCEKIILCWGNYLNFSLQFLHLQIYDPLITEFLKLGGIRCASPMEAGRGKAIIHLFVRLLHINACL